MTKLKDREKLEGAMRWMLISDAARLLKMSAAGVRFLATQGTLPCELTTGGIRLFRREDVEKLARAREQRR